MAYLRLRQVCMVARELEPVVQDVCAVLGLQVCHRDPGVERFGLHNALMRMGSAFIEVVAPLPGARGEGTAGEGTAATRHLARQGGDCGYMVILDCDDVAPWRSHMAAVGVREAAFLEMPGTAGQAIAYQGLQLHPRDTGGALLEINHTPGGASLNGPYWPAGPHWQSAADGRWGASLDGVTLRANDSAALAQRWARILKRPLSGEPDMQSLALDNGTAIHFTPATADDGPGFSQIDLHLDLAATEADAVFEGVAERAGARACAVDRRQRAVKISGVWWRFN